MEQLATPGSIRITAETLRLAEGFIQVGPLGPIPVKGLAEPVEGTPLSYSMFHFILYPPQKTTPTR
jgi:class 3 adenylate cyclase